MFIALQEHNKPLIETIISPNDCHGVKVKVVDYKPKKSELESA